MNEYPQKNYALLNREYGELNPVCCGTHRCPPEHTAYGLRDYYLIHYVESGTGMLASHGKTYSVSPGQIFIISEGEDAMYRADACDPWSYIYIGFRGRLATRFDALASPVVSVSLNSAALLRALIDREDTMEELAAAALFSLLADCYAGCSAKPHYVRRATEMINTGYMGAISVESISATLRLDRRYLSRIFKARMGVSVKEYIIAVRMERAMEHLSSGKSVAMTAELVGYGDAFNFSKMFKKCTGKSPREYAELNSRES